MKKYYFQPNINIVNIASRSLMTGSNNETFGAKGNANSSSTSVFSRKGSDWGDDEE